MIIPILLLLLGLAILILGGEIFVKGAASIARRLKVKPIVIGLTVVAFGTSAPELVVNLISAFQGAPDIAIGNVLGSNISNILLVLGIAAFIFPLTVKKGTTWKEIPFGILAVIVLFLLGNDVMFGNNGHNILGRSDGLVLISFFLIFAYYTYGLAKMEGDSDEIETYQWSASILFILGGIVCLILGGHLMVENGIILARLAGMSELLIGLTVTAIGTSLPELATSAIAAYRKHVDIAVGNVVGSNIFNILWVLGLTPVVAPIEMNPAVNFDILVAIGAAALLFIMMFVNKDGQRYSLRRWHGAFFVLLYILYVTAVVIRG